MKLKLLSILLIVILSPTITLAVSTKISETSLEQPKVKFLDEKSFHIYYTGTLKKSNKSVSCRIRSATFVGQINEIDCGALPNKCSASFFRLENNQVMAEVYGDLGNPQGSEFLGWVSFGAVNSQNQISLNPHLVFSSRYVQERVNPVERLIGFRDRAFCSVQIQDR